MEYWKKNINYRQDRQTNGTIRYLIRIDNEDIEVDEAIYKEYTRMERRERYLSERDAGICLSLDRFSEEELSGDYLLDCAEQNVETILLEKTDAMEREKLIHQLPQALLSLSELEQRIIRSKYLSNESERDIAWTLGISQPAVHKRLVNIQKKMKSYFEKNYSSSVIAPLVYRSESEGGLFQNECSLHAP